MTIFVPSTKRARMEHTSLISRNITWVKNPSSIEHLLFTYNIRYSVIALCCWQSLCSIYKGEFQYVGMSQMRRLGGGIIAAHPPNEKTSGLTVTCVEPGRSPWGQVRALCMYVPGILIWMGRWDPQRWCSCS